MFTTRSRAVALATLTSLALLAGCGSSSNDNKPDAPTGLKVIPGDGQVTITWDDQSATSDLRYWLFKAQAENATRDDYRKYPEATIIAPVTSPYILSGLTNGLPYSFFMNATHGNGPAGGETPTVGNIIPRQSGSVWTTNVAAGAGNLNHVSFAYGRFLAVGDSGAVQVGTVSWATGTPVLTWASAGTVPALVGTASTQPKLYGASYNSTTPRTVVVGDVDGSGKAAIWTSDGSSTNYLDQWVARTSNTTSALHGVALGSVGFVAVGDGGAVSISADGVTWTAYRLTVDTAANTANNASDRYTASASATADPSINLKSISVLNGTYYAVGDNGWIITSSDGISWRKHAVTSSAPANLTSVTYGYYNEAIYLAVGNNGKVYRNTDPSTLAWEEVSVAGMGDMKSVARGSRFMAVGTGSQAWVSSNGRDWVATSTSANENSVLWYSGGYIAVGEGGNVVTSY